MITNLLSLLKMMTRTSLSLFKEAAVPLLLFSIAIVYSYLLGVVGGLFVDS